MTKRNGKAHVRGKPARTPHDLTGRRFWKLTVLGRDPLLRDAKKIWLCRCDCGNERIVESFSLVSGKQHSCGCYRYSKGNPTHGLSGLPEFEIWMGMNRRCQDLNEPRYGGRGIRVCDRWAESFEAFLADVGPRPSPQHSIDRIDNDGHYEPGNVRWATRKQQARNTSRTRRVWLDGKIVAQADAAEVLGVSPATITRMVQRGELVRVERTHG